MNFNMVAWSSLHYCPQWSLLRRFQTESCPIALTCSTSLGHWSIAEAKKNWSIRKSLLFQFCNCWVRDDHVRRVELDRDVHVHVLFVYIASYYFILHYITILTLYYLILHYITLPYRILHTMTLYCITFQYITLYYIKWH